ncbi:uncharacterized protein LOC109845055 [Asparagus officinalis]|uniref:uncharacterized protein LOC109845055 n=1 Tax=Asparagus officinalis TaxID=4686 RepID=UPI00098DEB4D|nr:uncharacterized protein LOC109845055 [Asparagus officinalis]
MGPNPSPLPFSPALRSPPSTPLTSSRAPLLLQDAPNRALALTLTRPLRCDLDDLLLALAASGSSIGGPSAYLVGCEHWEGPGLVWLESGVLIPRPETEMVVDLVAEVEGFEGGVWADLGTGTGAIAIGIGRRLGEKGRVLATDLSEVAAETARVNVERYGLEGRVEVRQGSWFEPLRDVEGKLDGLVSNPPYIPSKDIEGLQEEVGRHEPRLALDGGEDGVECLVHLCEGAASALRPGGFFAFETNGEEQTDLIADLLITKWRKYFHNIKTVSDFARIKRFVTGYRR